MEYLGVKICIFSVKVDAEDDAGAIAAIDALSLGNEKDLPEYPTVEASLLAGDDLSIITYSNAREITIITDY